MPLDIINHEKFTFKIDAESQFMEYIIKPDVTIDVSEVMEGKKLIMEKYPDIKFFVLAQGVEFFSITKEARALAATKSHADNTQAVAFYTTNISLLLLGKMYMKIDKPHVLTKFFTDLNEAKQWLEKQMNKEQTGS